MTDYRSDMFFGALTGNGRILVVDDEPAIRKVVRMMLEKAGTTWWKRRMAKKPSTR